MLDAISRKKASMRLWFVVALPGRTADAVEISEGDELFCVLTDNVGAAADELASRSVRLLRVKNTESARDIEYAWTGA